MQHLAAVAAGGALGASARYLLGAWVLRLWPGAPLPPATLAVNVLGCFAIGLFAGRLTGAPQTSPSWTLFVMTGLLGGFTTFSAFANEVWLLGKDETPLRALALVLAHVVLGLVAVGLGYALTTRGS